MRNYWMKIFLGAFAIFAIGMIGVTLVRSGIAKVNAVVEGDDPIELPLGFIPFTLAGERLGTLDRLVLVRDAPRRVTAVELSVELTDTLVAQGLSGCRLAAHFEGRPGEPGVNIRARREGAGAFSCLPGDSTPADLVEFGEAVFEPGEIRVPLYLQRDLVEELQTGFGEDTTMAFTPEQVDSITEAARRQVDSAFAAAGLTAPEHRETLRRFADSLREAALAQADSIRRAEMADPAEAE